MRLGQARASRVERQVAPRRVGVCTAGRTPAGAAAEALADLGRCSAPGANELRYGLAKFAELN